MADTTPVTTLEGAVFSFTQVSRREFGSIWIHSTQLTKSCFINLAPSVGTTFSYSGLKRSFQSTSTFRWNPTKILQLWLSKFRLLQPLSRSSLDRIKKWSYDFSRRKIGLEPIKKMREIASEGVTVEGQLPRTNPTQTIFGRWEKRWTSWGRPLKDRWIKIWTGWLGQQIFRSLRQSWSALCCLNSNYLNLSHLTGLRTPWTTSTLSKQL